MIDEALPGHVYLVGAGPGDPGLLTVTANRLLQSADVILHDSLVGSDIINRLPEDAMVIDVGKRPGPTGERTSQTDIHELVVDHASAGRSVVRLKGGDPTMFGRGGEEAEHLAASNVPFEIIPGVSSVVAAPGIVGIPVTQRGVASSVTVVTGHETPTKDTSSLDWAALADIVTSGGTLLILMGVNSLPTNVKRLQQHGVAADTPVAMIEKATWDDQSTVTGELATIVDAASEAAIEPPAVTVVGEVVSVRDRVKHALANDNELHSSPGIEGTEDWVTAIGRVLSTAHE